MKTFNLAVALADISDGLRMRNVWLRLAIDDLRLRYSRTRLGPSWLSLGMVIYIGGLGLIWGTLFNMDLEKFYPYMAVGLITWHFITASVGEGVNSFVGANGIISAVPLPLSVHINRQVVRVLVSLIHTLPIGFLVSLFCGIGPNLIQLFIFPAVLVLAINCWWVTLFLGIVGARFRDVGHIITTFMPFMFFLTPILWDRSMLKNLAFIADYNPFTHYIEIVRQPLMGQLPPSSSYIVVGVITVIGISVTTLVFARTRHRIVFWL
tara:strand:- start:1667 stop:2461 length:795 start_codon:yes stop_codon:yes gene_type:complete